MPFSSFTAAAPQSDDTPSRERAKERLYVVCQLGGWIGLLVVQSILVRLFAKQSPGKDLDGVYIALTQTVLLGLLITHYSRRWLQRWNWKNLGWRKLAPRVVGYATVLSLLWCVLGYAIYYGLLQMPYTTRLPMPLMFATSAINGVLLMTAWLSIYFFYHLFDRFNRLEVEGLRLSASAKEAELRALKSQVNPHFIFNSLNSLRALIDEEPARARQAVTQLANLLRYSLQSGQLETVPLEEELRTVNDYLALEQIRHEERLRVRLDVAPDTLSLPIPPLLLQTLVENAVKYGISARPEGGEIAIRARRENGALRLQVSNPGELAETAPKGGQRGSSTGLGLRNAAERLRLLFGDRAQLELRAASPEIVLAEAILPLTAARA